MKENMKENRLISFLQVWGIILVVVGHSFEAYYRAYHYNCIVRDWIYTFHMPLFVFISGYLFLYSIQISHRTLEEIPLWGRNGFFIKKVQRLLLPYLLISTIAFFPKALLSKFAMRGVELSWRSWIDMLIYPWDNVIIFFWFLPMLFLIFCIVISVTRIASHFHWKISIYIILPLLLVLHLFNPLKDVRLFDLSDVMKYLIYFVLGCFYFMDQKHIDKLFVNKAGLIAFILLLVSFVFLEFNFLGSDVLASVNGILLSIALGYIYINFNLRFFQHLNGMSYTIYLLSWFPQVFFQQILLNICPLPWEVITVLAIVSGVYVPFFIAKLIEKLGKENRSRSFLLLIIGR